MPVTKKILKEQINKSDLDETNSLTNTKSKKLTNETLGSHDLVAQQDIKTPRKTAKKTIIGVPTETDMTPKNNSKLITRNVNNKKKQKNSVTVNTPHQPPIPIYANADYVFNNKDYYYLNDGSNHYEFINTFNENTTNKPIKVNFCLFKLNDECNEPFLEYLLEIVDKTLSFQDIIIPSTDFDDETKDVRDTFEKLCFNKFKEIVSVDDDTASKSYKGFLELTECNLYVFFDCTFLSNILLKPTQVWGILDEIINERRIFDNVIDNNIFILFQKYQYLTNIYNKFGDKIPIPSSLYICEVDSTKYIPNDDIPYLNVYYKDSENNRENKRFVHDMIEHDVFGDNYYFSTDPVNDDKSNDKIKRFAVFIHNALYILNVKTPLRNIDFFNKDSDDDVNEDKIKSHKDYNCVYFYENQKQYWCIKNTDRFTEL